MGKIIAKGKILGFERVITCTLVDGYPVIEVDGEYDEDIQSIFFDALLKNPPPIGGTYYPPADSMLAAYSVLQSKFFDMGSPVEIEVEGDIGEIPTPEDDVIY